MFFLRFKMIVFKLLLAGLKKNLGLRYSKFYFREVKTKTRLEKRLYIIYFGPIQGVHLNPLGSKTSRPCLKPILTSSIMRNSAVENKSTVEGLN